MALIECAESLSSATKAKLQDAGILYVSDVVDLFSSKGYGVVVDGDRKQASALQNLGTAVTHRVPPSSPPGQPRPRQHPNGGNRGRCAAQGNPSSISRITEATARSSPSKEDDVSTFMHLTEDEMREVVELAARAIVGVAEEHEGSKDAASSAEGNDAVHGVVSPSPPRAPTFSCCAADSAPKTGEPAQTSDSRFCAIPGCRTVREIQAELQARQAQGFPTHLTTFSRELDRVLGGGVPVGGVTEISGPPGVGKTQLLMQLAVSCAMPVEFGGMGGACLFVDTEGSFVAERLEQMATAAVSLVRSILLTQPQPPRNEAPAASSSGPRQSHESHKKRGRSSSLDAPKASRSKPDCTEFGSTPDIQSRFTVESVLQRVHYIRVVDLAGLMAVLHSLPAWLAEERTAEAKAATTSDMAGISKQPSRLGGKSPSSAYAAVRMILIDSIALPFRSSDDYQREGAASRTGNNGDNSMPLLNYSGVNAALNGLHWQSSNRPLSKRGLWRRSRLLFQCSTLLEQLAATFQLAIAVTNHMTTKMLHDTALNSIANGSSAGNPGYSVPNGEENVGHHRQSVLVPALGDAWGQGLSTRILLSFHHYNVPACSFGARSTSLTASTECTEDVVYLLSSRQSEPQTSLRSVVQHRVVRVLKCSGQPRRETCFVVSSKGIRDFHRDLVSQQVARSVGGRALHE
ncbi:recombinase rad51, putative [Leishmania tarentolae]|uniref:DNA repair protein RAD51 homolog 3 n=1 Tax=Leishmania tarentolae TaxID=5689 RepID=A0A640KSC0_LEITA|nr:recombinase rad51, putative [Leishmania tarentolae]